MEDGEIDQSVRGQKKVGDDGCDDVQFSWKTAPSELRGSLVKSGGLCLGGPANRRAEPTDQNKSQSDAEGQDVRSQGLVVLSITLCKDAQSGIDVILTQGLE